MNQVSERDDFITEILSDQYYSKLIFVMGYVSTGKNKSKFSYCPKYCDMFWLSRTSIVRWIDYELPTFEPRDFNPDSPAPSNLGDTYNNSIVYLSLRPDSG